MSLTARGSRSVIAAAALCSGGAILADVANPSAYDTTEPPVPAAGIATPLPQGRRDVVDALGAPRYVRSDAVALPRVAIGPAGAGGMARLELSEISRRWWLSHDRAQVGVGLGSVGYSVPAFDARRDEATPTTLRNAVPAVSVGMRYRVSTESALYADASNAPGLYGKGSDAYSAKMGVEWQSGPQRGWGFMQGGVGMRLDSGKTMTMRVKGGGLGVYLRSKF